MSEKLHSSQDSGLTANKARKEAWGPHCKQTCKPTHPCTDAHMESQSLPQPQPLSVQKQIASRQFCCQLKILSLVVDWKHHMVKCFLWCWCEWWLTWRGWIVLDRPIFRCLLRTPTLILIHRHTHEITHACIRRSIAEKDKTWEF